MFRKAGKVGSETLTVVIPELFARDATAGDDEVTVLALPAGFDAACARDVAGLN